jgi:O-methyltransferase
MNDLQISREQLAVILGELRKALAVDGDVVEFGCYNGDTSLQLGRMLKRFGSDKELWLYDSFEGLPEKTEEDVSMLGKGFRTGALRAGRNELLRRFRRADLTMPMVVKGWFEELDAVRDVPAEIAFALLDGDYYSSIQVSLGLVAPKLVAGGVIMVHDYDNEALPGVKRAVGEFLGHNMDFGLRVQNGLAILDKNLVQSY